MTRRHENVLELRRIEMEAHLEGLAYTGTAAAEKTLRSIDPTMRDQMPIQQMLRIVKADGRPAEEREFGSALERWWFGERQIAAVARDLHNDAAHRVYDKAPGGPLWRIEIAGHLPRPVGLEVALVLALALWLWPRQTAERISKAPSAHEARGTTEIR